MKLSATVKEAVADGSAEIAQEGGPERVLAPDFERAKTAVLNSLTSASGRRTYDHAIREFVARYCSELRLAFNRTVALRYRMHLEQRGTRRRRSIFGWPLFAESRTGPPTPVS